METNKTGRITKRELDQTIFRIALPCVLENLLVFAATLVIAGMIGRLTADEISAQSIGGRITGILTALFKGIGVGSTIILGVYFGRNDLKRVQMIEKKMLWITLASSLALSVLAFALPKPFLRVFSSDENFVQMAAPYVRIAIWMVPCNAISRIVTAAFNARGNTRTPMVIAVLLNFVNAGLGYLTIFVMKIGLAGAAISLTGSNFIGMAAGLLALYRLECGKEKALMENHFGGELTLGRDILDVFKTGLPASLESMMWSFSSIIMSRAMLTFDTTSYAGYQLASQIEEFLAAPCFGFGVAATALIAQCMGRKDNGLGRTYHKRILFWTAVVTVPLALILILVPGMAMRILTDKEDIAAVGAIYLIIAGIGFVPQALNMVDFGVIRAQGGKILPLAATICGMWLIRVPVAATAAWLLKTTITLVFIGIVADCTIRWVIGVIYVRIKIHKKQGMWSI